MDPWFFTSFTDGECCFNITIYKDNRQKIGWLVILSFQISLHEKDITLLKQIQFQFNVGNITKQGSQSVQFRISSVKDLAVIIEHFNKYPLITQKWADYELFKQAFYIVKNKEHLTMEGLHNIVAIKASMNTGLSNELKAAFPNVVPVKRPRVKDQ